MRSEFERLPLVAEILNDADIFYNECSCLYENKLYITFVPEEITFLNGAWYAFQEQKKKINDVLQTIDWHVEDCNTINDSSEYNKAWKEALEFIKSELLK